MKTYELTIDDALCWGCKTCEVACKQENRSADGIKLISVTEDGPRIVDGLLDFESVSLVKTNRRVVFGRYFQRRPFQTGASETVECLKEKARTQPTVAVAVPVDLDRQAVGPGGEPLGQVGDETDHGAGAWGSRMPDRVAAAQPAGTEFQRERVEAADRVRIRSGGVLRDVHHR